MKNCSTNLRPSQVHSASIGSLPNQDNLVSKFSNQSIGKLPSATWWSSITIFSLLIFILLNAFLLSTRAYSNLNNQSKPVDLALSKLRQMVLNSPYEGDQSGPWPWWIARAYFTGAAPDIVIFGDSQINAAFIQADAMTTNTAKDCVIDRSCIALTKALQQHGEQASTEPLHLVNLALGGAMPSDYYLMSKAFFTKNSHPKIVIISLSPRSFLDATFSSANTTETFQFLSPLVELGNLIDYSFTNPVEKYFWLAKNKLSLFTYQQDIQLAVHNIIMHYTGSLWHSKTGLPSPGLHLPAQHQPAQSIYGGTGFVTVGSNVVGPNPSIPFRDNKPEYLRRFAQLKSQTLAAQSAYLQATLAHLKQLGVQVIVVDMPMLEPVRALLPATFWNSYSLGLKNICLANNAYWFDLVDSPEFPQAEFLDYVHLNATGGKHFIDLLANFMASNPRANLN